MTEIGGAAAAEAARIAAIEAAKRAAAAAAKRQAAAAAKKAPQQQAARTQATRDAAAVESGAGKIEAAAKSADNKSPWSFTQGIGELAKVGGALGKVAKQGLETMQRAEAQKTQEFVAKASRQLSEEGARTLEQLAQRGKLDASDGSGSNLRDHMDEFLSEGGDPAMAEAIMAQIAHPVREIQQVRDETCVAANNMQALADQNPGEYFRMASELATEGKTTFPGGEELELSAETQEFVEDHASTPGQRASAAMQAALMEFANGHQDYNMAKDTSSTEIDVGWIDFSLGSQEGVTIEQAKALQDVLGTAPMVDPRDMADASDAQRADFLAKSVDEAREDGYLGVQVPVHADVPGSDEKYHMVELRGVTEDVVKLYDVAEQRVYEMDRQDFIDNVGWDITADDGIGATRGVRSGGGGLGSLAP